jgi:hypothetical protein
MGQLQIPGTSVVYSNPKQVDQTTLTFSAGFVTPGYPPNVNGTLAGQVWQPNGPTSTPQPGSFDAGTPNVPQPKFNNPGVSNSAPNSGSPVVTTKNADASTRTANGTIPGTSVTINNPA